ncbi:MAG: MFS transporter [Solirubrobacterales bacterium]|nr:MFS transporter [Solirubrobacterales bacterium]
MASMGSSLRVPGFAPLAGSYALNELGDNFGIVALAVLVLDETGSALGTAALFLAAKFLPALVAPAMVAALDRRPVGRVLPVFYVVEAAAFAALALVAGSFWLPAVLVLGFVDGLVALTARGLSRGAVATTLQPAGLLREGNALLNVAFAVTSAGGPALAGLVVSAGGPALALWIDAGSFLAVAVLLAAYRRVLPVPAPAERREPWSTRVRDGIRYVRRHPVAGRLVGGEALAIVFFTIAVPIDVVYAKETLDAGDLGFGLLLASWGVGILLGSAIFARARSWPVATLVLLSTAAIGAGYGGMALAPGLAVACLASVVGGTGNGVQWVAVMTALQESVHDDYQARAAGLLESAAAAMPGVGFVVGGVIAWAADPRVAFLVAAFGVLLLTLAWARKPLVHEPAAA